MALRRDDFDTNWWQASYSTGSMTRFSCCLFWKPNGTLFSITNYGALLANRGGPGLIVSGIAGNKIAMEWEGSEFNADGVAWVADVWNFFCGTADPDGTYVYGGVVGSKTLNSFTNSHATTSKSPTKFDIGSDSFDATSRRAAGDYAELAFEVGIRWSEDTIRQMLSGISPIVARPTSTFYAPFIRDTREMKSAAPIVLQAGINEPAAHPSVRYNNRRQIIIPQAVSPPPPPPPSVLLSRPSYFPLLGVGD